MRDPTRAGLARNGAGDLVLANLAPLRDAVAQQGTAAEDARDRPLIDPWVVAVIAISRIVA
jgi:hypothetical protein